VYVPDLLLIDREGGGHLVVDPPVPVWDRTELSKTHLEQFSYLVASTARAMLDTLPQLQGGCINYWDAGNWALNIDANPAGTPKTGRAHRKLHMHLLGRSPRSPLWGESPDFPTFKDRLRWASAHRPLNDEELARIAERLPVILQQKYGMPAKDLRILKGNL
jgi:hypothetical protein